jgi:peptidoglycan/LPS O-acetylase OafA/YrhL
LALVILQGIFVPRYPILHLTILGNLQFFLLGYLLADVYLLDWKERPKNSRYWDLLAAAGWVALYSIWELKFYEAYFLPALIFVIYAGAFRGVFANRIFTWRWLTTIGGMCYSIYLTHSFLLGRLAHYTDRLMLTDYFFVHFIMRAVMVIPLLLLFATVFFVLIEKPCMQRDWPQRLMRKLKSLFVTPVVQPASE